MRQYELINKIIEILVDNQYIHYAFLKGSFACGKEDNYSNVDIYLKLKIDKEEEFFENYVYILESYRPILFLKAKEFKEIRVIYDDNINLNLYLIDDLKRLNIKHSIVKLYDPDNLLEDIYDYSLMLSDEEIAGVVDEISLACYDFHRLYLRNEYTVIMHVVSKIHELYSIILHYYYSKEDSKLGINKIFTNMDVEGRKRYIAILKEWKLDSVKKCVLMMLDDVFNIVCGFNINIANHMNFDFFNDMKKKITLL